MLRIAVFLFLFKEYYCFLVLPPINETSDVNPLFSRRPINSGDTPVYFDWRDLNMVSPVKDQGECNACWAFSSIANIESHLKIYLNVEEVLSEQFLLDCDPAQKGCGDGSIIETFANIVAEFGGVLRDKDYYPYVHERRQCRWEKPDASKYGSLSFFEPTRWDAQPVPVIGFRRVIPDEENMAKFVFENGPLSAAINSASMARYKGNIIDDPTDEDCDPKQLNHAVLIVGYNVYIGAAWGLLHPKHALFLVRCWVETTRSTFICLGGLIFIVGQRGKQVPYWIIKNSWGEDWGNDGYYYLVRGRNACGIASDVSFAYVS